MKVQVLIKTNNPGEMMMPQFTSFLLIGLLTVPGLLFEKSKTISFNYFTELAITEADTLEWERPRFSEFEDERNDLAEIIISQGIKDQEVIDAIRHVPRHLFVNESQRNQAHQNNPLPIGHGQTISQPFIVAYMSEMLEIEVGDKVLEIGTGSGYHAAVLSELTPHIFSIEIVEPLAELSSNRYDELGYHTIETKTGDGYYGWEEHAPFDKIIVTAAPGHIPPPLMDQLKPGGLMAIPVGSAYQTQNLMKITKMEDGNVRTERMLPVRFVPMTGEALD